MNSNPSVDTTSDTEYEITDERLRMLHNCILSPNGIVYETAILQIGIKSIYTQDTGQYSLYIGNKSRFELTKCIITLEHLSSYSITETTCIPSTILSGEQVSCSYLVKCITGTLNLPRISISYHHSSQDNSIKMFLPIYVGKFCEPCELKSNDFLQRWNQMSKTREFSEQVILQPDISNRISIQRIIEGLGFFMLDGFDPNPDNLIGSCVFFSYNEGQVGGLVRIEGIFEKNVLKVTVRAINLDISRLIGRGIIKICSNSIIFH